MREYKILLGFTVIQYKCEREVSMTHSLNASHGSFPK